MIRRVGWEAVSVDDASDKDFECSSLSDVVKVDVDDAVCVAEIEADAKVTVVSPVTDVERD